MLLMPAAILTAQSTDELRAQIEKNNKTMQQAMIKGDFETGMAFYADEVVSLPSYSKMLQGREAIRQSNQAMMASGMKMTAFETAISMLTTCENNVLEIGTYKMRYTMPGAPGEIADEGKYLTIWVVQPDGSLKIIVETWNPDTYPAGGM